MGLFRNNPHVPPFDGIPHYKKPPADAEAWLDEVFDGRDYVAFTTGLRFMAKMTSTIGSGSVQRGYRMESSPGESPILQFRLRD